MPAFALPRAVSPRVAATLSRFAHYPLLDRVSQRARTYDIAPAAGAVRAAPPQGVPQQLTLIFDGADRSTPTQLHLGRVPVPSRFWSYDADRGILRYTFNSGGVDHVGSLTFVHAASSAIGTLSVGSDHVGVTASLQPVSYTCDVAITPAAFVTGVAPALTLHWDATDPRWSNATWVENALTFTWQVTGRVIVGQPTYSIAVSFRDQQTRTPWGPIGGTISALLDANLNFTMTLAGGLTPPPDDRSGLPAPASSIGSVFPHVLGFSLSTDGTAMTGALLTGQASQAGTVLGLRGRVVNPSVAGLYSVSGARGAAGAIAVYGGRLFINDALVETASLTGSRLAWSGMTAAQRRHSGLPESGVLVFPADGAQFQATDGGTSGRRVRPDQIAQPSPGLSATPHPALATASALSPTSALSLQALGSMTQFAFVNNVWVDAVQRATMSDFNQILQYYMPEDMRQAYYDPSPPTLPPWLQTIAAQGTNPAAMYQSLATAYLTNILSHFNEDGANQLNAARAMTWLKAQTAASPVFQQHTTAIYAAEFINRPQNAALPQYRQDQASQAATYAGFIASDAQQWQQTLAQTIQNPAALAAMQQLVTDLSTRAITDDLYWAYAFFRYLTTPEQLGIIRMISLGNTSDLDGSAFMRQCQANAAILSLLDPSHTFSQQYVEVIQVFQIGNLLPPLFDLSGPDPDDFAFALKLVLQQLAQTYQGNGDPDVAGAAAAASALAQDPNLRDYVGLVQSIASANAGLIAWEQLAPAIQNELAAKIAPEVLGVFMTAVPSVGLMGMVCGTMQWNSLSADESATLAANGAELAIELVCAVVKRGVAIAAIWDTSASSWEIFKGLLGRDILKEATSRLSNAFRRWIVESDEDTVGHAVSPGALLRDEMTGEVLAGPDEQGLVSKIFGRNLDDLLATRLGAALAVVNLVLSIYAAVQASDPLERVADGLMATTAGLDLIAAVGGWALGALGITEIGTVAVATIASTIGVLGILATLAGIAILLYLVLRPRQNPVQQFISSYAGPAGFVMPYGSEIDYFVGYTTGTEPARVGCSFVVDPGTSTVLSVASDGTTAEAAGQSYGYRSVFVIATGGTGQSRIITVVPTGSGGLQTVVLTWATGNTVSFQPPLAPASPDYVTQLWTLQMQGAPQMDGAFPAAATFAVTASGTSSALVWNGTNLILGSGPGWRIEQTPMAPAGLSMQRIRLYTVSNGQSFRPTLTQNGSAPRTWSVAPALPSFLTLGSTSGQIAQSTSTGGLPVMPATPFALSVTNGVGTAPPPAPFTIEVRSYP